MTGFSLSSFLNEASLRGDSVFRLLFILAVVVFVVGEAYWLLRKLTKSHSVVSNNKLPPEDTRFEMIWTVIPLGVLMVLFVHQARGFRPLEFSLKSLQRKSHSNRSDSTVSAPSSSTVETK